MSVQSSRDVSLINDEETLRKMWQDTDDFGRKKEIRAHMYKLREARLRDFYNSGEVNTEIKKTSTESKSCSASTHTDSLQDHSFISMKTKEIRDSESPTKDEIYRIDKNLGNQGWSIMTSNQKSDDGKTFTTTKQASTSGSDKIPGGQIDYNATNKQTASVYEDGDDKNYRKSVGASSNTLIQQEASGGDDNSQFRSSSTKTTSSSKFVSEQKSTSGDVIDIAPSTLLQQDQNDKFLISRKIYTDNIPNELKNHPNFIEGKTKVTRETRTLPDGTTVTTTRYEIRGDNTIQSMKSAQKSSTIKSSEASETKTNQKETRTILEPSTRQICDSRNQQATTTRTIKNQAIDNIDNQASDIKTTRTVITKNYHSQNPSVIIKNQNLDTSDNQNVDTTTRIIKNQEVDTSDNIKKDFGTKTVRTTVVNQQPTTTTRIIKNQEVDTSDNIKQDFGTKTTRTTVVKKIYDSRNQDISDNQNFDTTTTRIIKNQEFDTSDNTKQDFDTKTTRTIVVNQQPTTRIIKNQEINIGDNTDTKTTTVRKIFDSKNQQSTTRNICEMEPQDSKVTTTIIRTIQQPVDNQITKNQDVTTTRTITIKHDDTKIKQNINEDFINLEQEDTRTRIKPSVDEKYSLPEKRQPIKPGLSEFDKKPKPTEGQYETTYRSDFTNKKISVEVSPTHDAFARSLRAVTPDRLSKSPNRSLRTSNNSLRSSTSPEKMRHPSRVSPERRSVSPKKTTETINRKTDTFTRTNTNEIDSSTLTRQKPKPRSQSPTSIASDIEYIRNTNLVTDLDTNETTIISTRPTNLNITTKVTKKVTERSPTSPLTDFSPKKPTPRDVARTNSLRNISPSKETTRIDKPLKRTNTYEERCRQILGIATTENEKKTKTEIRRVSGPKSPEPKEPQYPGRTQSPNKILKSSPSKELPSPTKKSPQEPVRKTPMKETSKIAEVPSPGRKSPIKQAPKISEFPSQIRKSPEKQPLEPYPEKKSLSQIKRSPEKEPLGSYPDRKQPSICEFPSQIRRSPEREPLEPYPEKKGPIKEGPRVSEFPSQIRKSPEKEPLESYPEKRRPTTEEPTICEFPSQIRKSLEKEPLEAYPERKSLTKDAPSICEFPSQIRKSPEKEPLEPYPDKKRPTKDASSVSEFPSQIRKSPEKEPLEPYPEKKRPTKDAPSICEFPSQIRKSPEKEPLEPYPEKKRPTKDAPSVSEFPSQIRKSPEKEPLEPYPEKKRPTKEAPTICEFPSQIRKSPEKEPLEPYPEKQRPKKEEPKVSEFPSQIRKSAEKEPLEPYPEKKRPTKDAPSVSEFPSQIRKSPEKQPLEPYPEKGRPRKEEPKVSEFPSQIRKSPEKEPLEPYPEKKHPTEEKPKICEFPSQIRKSPEKEPLEPYPEKKRPTEEKPKISEFPPQTRKSLEKEPLEPYPERKRPTKEAPTICEFPSQIRKPAQLRPSPETQKTIIKQFIDNESTETYDKEKTRVDILQTQTKKDRVEPTRRSPTKKYKPKLRTDSESSSEEEEEIIETIQTTTVQNLETRKPVDEPLATKKFISQLGKDEETQRTDLTKHQNQTILNKTIIDTSKTKSTTVKKELSKKSSDTLINQERKETTRTSPIKKPLSEKNNQTKKTTIINKKPKETKKTTLYDIENMTKTKDNRVHIRTHRIDETITKKPKPTTNGDSPKPKRVEEPKSKKRIPSKTIIEPETKRTTPKRHIVTTTITVGTTKPSKSPTKQLTQKPIKKKPTQNGHISSDDESIDTPKKPTKTQPELPKPKQKCITTKSIIINNETAEREVIVDLQRSKSSREPTPDRICPLPVSSDEEDKTPRYPDQIAEPDDNQPRRKSTRITDIPIIEGEDTTEFNRITEISFDKKINKFDTSTQVKKPERPKIDRPKLQVTEDLESDDCLLSVSEKVNKFITTAEQLTAPQDLPQRPKSPKCQFYREEETKVSDKLAHFITTAEKVITSEKSSQDIKKNISLAKIDKKSLSPEPKETTPSRRPSNQYSSIRTETQERRYPRRDSSPKLTDSTPKSTGDKPRSATSPIDRLRSTESVKKAKALFENINREEIRQKDILSRPSVFETRRRLDYDDKSLKSTQLLLGKPRDRSKSSDKIDRRSETPEGDLPNYMKPLDRSLRPNSPHRDSLNQMKKPKDDEIDNRQIKGGRQSDSGQKIITKKPVDITEEEIDGIYELEILEELLEKIVNYEIRRKIRTQIRLVKQLIADGKLEEITRKQTTTTYSYNQRKTEYSKIIKRSESPETIKTRSPTPPKTQPKFSKITKRSESPETIKTRSPTPPKTQPKFSKIIKRNESPETTKTRSPTPPKTQPKLFQTELRKTTIKPKPIPEDTTPEWVKQRKLKKITDSSLTRTTTTTKKTRSSPVKETKPIDTITSSYGVGPTDENGSPLFGLKALRLQQKTDTSKVQGTVIKSQYYSENGKEPIGEITVTKYSSDPKDLGRNDVKTKGLTSITTTQKFGYKDTPSFSTLTSIKKKKESGGIDDGKTSKLNRRGSVKAISQKFIENAVETSRSERQAYPKAGLILRTSSFKESASSGDSREGSVERTTVKTSTTRTVSGESFLTNRSKVSGVQDVICRMKTEDIREGDSAEDIEARGLLNKFLGAQVILSGIESNVKSSTTNTKKATKITTTITEGGKPITKTRIFQHPISDEDLQTVWDEQTLRLLLEQSSDYEERRTLRARLRQVMAEQEACTELVEKASQDQVSSTFEETGKTYSGGPVTTSQVTTRVTQQVQSKKPISPFAKFRQLDKQNSLNSPSTPKTPSGSGPLFKFTDPAVSQSASTIKDRLLHWCRMKTKEYENIQLDNFSTSWADGLAFCALIHHFLPDSFDYHALTPKNRRYNFTLAFKVADEKADIAPLLDVDDMVATRKPDWKCVFTYVQSIYRRFKDED